MQCCWSVTLARDTLPCVFLLRHPRLQGTRIVLEMENLWLLQISKYWLYILPVLESLSFFLLQHGKGTTEGRLMSQECHFCYQTGAQCSEREGMSL